MKHDAELKEAMMEKERLGSGSGATGKAPKGAF